MLGGGVGIITEDFGEEEAGAGIGDDGLGLFGIGFGGEDERGLRGVVGGGVIGKVDKVGGGVAAHKAGGVAAYKFVGAVVATGPASLIDDRVVMKQLEGGQRT